MLRAKAVENRTPKIFSPRDANDLRRARLWRHPSRIASLDRRAGANKIDAVRNFHFGQSAVIVHHFEEVIGSRTYQIEAMPIGNRWRAQLRRGPGMPTAMMPFYGQTPDEAARQLLQWLTLAHQRCSMAAGPHGVNGTSGA